MHKYSVVGSSGISLTALYQQATVSLTSVINLQPSTPYSSLTHTYLAYYTFAHSCIHSYVHDWASEVSKQPAAARHRSCVSTNGMALYAAANTLRNANFTHIHTNFHVCALECKKIYIPIQVLLAKIATAVRVTISPIIQR